MVMASPVRQPSVMPWFGLAAVVIGIDQITKAWIASVLQVGEGVAVTSFFNLVYVFNSGAAFSFLADGGGWQRWFFVALALGISAYITVLLIRHLGDRVLAAALALVLGGALGNVIDRLRFGAVVDFLDVHAAGWHWPAFNIADSAICLGVGLLLLQQIREPAAGRKKS